MLLVFLTLLFHQFAYQCRRRRFLYPHFYELADVVSALRENDRLVLRAAAEKVIVRALRVALDQHLECLAHVFAVALSRLAVLHLDYLVQTPDFHVLRHIVGQMLAGECAWPLAVLEHERHVEADLLHQTKRLLVVLLGLAVEAGEDAL